MTTHILILCTHNSARSVLAEAMLNHLAAAQGLDVRGHSAGSAPSGRVNPQALEVLAAAGVATQGLRSKSWDEFSAADAPPMDIVITDGWPSDAQAPARPLSLADLERMGNPVLLPTPPFSIGCELAFDPVLYPRFAGYEQKKLLLPVQKAIIRHLLDA